MGAVISEEGRARRAWAHHYARVYWTRPGRAGQYYHFVGTAHVLSSLAGKFSTRSAQHPLCCPVMVAASRELWRGNAENV